jgi:lysyl-tRNA synthetase class 2
VDAHIDPIPVQDAGQALFLQTSPEFAMKRLLAAGSGSIFEITRSFRGGERGERHNREFTLIEWYRVGVDHVALMDEVGDFVSMLTGLPRAGRTTYREAFRRALGLDPLTADEESVWSLARTRGLSARPRERDDLLNFLWADGVEPSLGWQTPLFIHDYPGTQSALAKTRIDVDGSLVAERFELYVRGVELCNGYHELTDADELRRRNIEQNRRRRELGKGELPVDSKLLGAMGAGLADCAGVALGFDRLVMIAVNASSLAEVMAFPDALA